MEREFIFSVVMPIYNVEKYLEEAILSVVNQTLDFKKNIQLILVNDGSPDGSEKICLKFKELFPDNVTYIKQKNAGVSVARNRGKKEARGKYINFFDSDDIWDLRTFESVYHFFEKHQNEIDIVSCRLQFFGSRNGEHPLNFKYKKDAIIDIDKQPDYIQLSASSAFIKQSVLSKIDFDPTVSYSEDALLLTQLITQKGSYGVVKEGTYYYRRRLEEDSAIQQSTDSYEWYFGTPEKSYQYLIEKSKKIKGHVLKYVQHYVMYDLQWRLKKPFSKLFSENEKSKYLSNIKKILQDIDDEVIFSQKNISSEYKLYALGIKYNQDINRQLTIKDNTLYYKKFKIHYLINKFILKINIMDFQDNVLRIDGQFRTVLDKRDYEVYAQDNNGEKYPISLQGNHLNSSVSIDRTILQSNSFALEIPVNNELSLSIYLKYKNFEPVRLRCNFYQHSKLSNVYKLYYLTDKKIIFNAGHSIIKVVKRSRLKRLRFAFRTQWDFFKHRQFKTIFLRFFSTCLSLFYRKPIWLISDRLSFANDNGKQLFKYINERYPKKAHVYFVLDKNSKDYDELKTIGKVVSYNSLKYKLLFLLSSNIISSSAEDWVINPFGKRRELYKDLYTFDFVFLQHGVIKNDLSTWLNKLNKNINLFVTSASKERESIVNGDYGYSEKEVKLTGLPRFDHLEDKKEKKIVIMPTWRKGLVGKDSARTPGEREYSGAFKETDYFKFYNSLINHPKLLETLQKNGYTGSFVVHPSHLNQSVDFDSNAYFKVNSGFANYSEYFNTSALLVTDYSSVAMDFAYLDKPVIYCQFDQNIFYKDQMYVKGYFDDEKDGFGPVLDSLEKTVDAIIASVESGCVQDAKYSKRMQRFYEYHDHNNSERVYNEILKLANKK